MSAVSSVRSDCAKGILLYNNTCACTLLVRSDTIIAVPTRPGLTRFRVEQNISIHELCTRIYTFLCVPLFILSFCYIGSTTYRIQTTVILLEGGPVLAGDICHSKLQLFSTLHFMLHLWLIQLAYRLYCTLIVLSVPGILQCLVQTVLCTDCTAVSLGCEGPDPWAGLAAEIRCTDSSNLIRLLHYMGHTALPCALLLSTSTWHVCV